MGSDLPRVLLQFLNPTWLVDRFKSFEIGLQRGFRIHDDILIIGQLNHHVGSKATLLGGRRLLLEKIAVIEHSGDLNDPFQLDFTPAASNDWSPEGLHQIGCLPLELNLGRPEMLDLFR